MTAKQSIIESLSEAVKKITGEELEVKLEVPENSSHGDYSSNLPLVLSKKLGKSPKEIAENIQGVLLENPLLEKVEIAGPGFLNFYISQEQLVAGLSDVLSQKEQFGNARVLKDKKIIVEFAHPNTHKEFHIGHVRNITTGEVVARLSESQGADVSRVNYQGDVGMHVAKALFGVRKKLEEQKVTIEEIGKKSPQEKAQFLGEAYALGSKYFEEDEETKKEIGVLNKQIYAKDPEILSLWEETRRWSLEYFESIYKRVGTTFDRFFFESEVYDTGREIVLSHIDDGIFIRDQGAVIFPGEKYGLHNRVFVTSEGNPTYEGKEMGLGPLQFKEFHFDKALHVVGPEQAGYFQVVFKALEQVNPELVGRERHIVYGFVQLKDGKMSSRLGNIIRGEWLFDEAKEKILESFPEIDPDTAEKIAVGAVKYSMLKVGREANISFSFEDSINLHGNSGPYIQYAYARTQSILRKAGEVKHQKDTSYQPEQEEIELLRTFVHFSDVVTHAQVEFAPNYICTYLFDLTQKFSLFYEKHRITNAEDESAKSFRIGLTAGVGQILKNGLSLLGIEAPEKI